MELRAKKSCRTAIGDLQKLTFSRLQLSVGFGLLGSNIFCLSVAGFRSENNLGTDPILFSDPDMAPLKGQGHEIITG